MKLSELKTGGMGTVTRVAGDARFVSRVTSIGITEGCQSKSSRTRRSVRFWCSSATA